MDAPTHLLTPAHPVSHSAVTQLVRTHTSHSVYVCVCVCAPWMSMLNLSTRYNLGAVALISCAAESNANTPHVHWANTHTYTQRFGADSTTNSSCVWGCSSAQTELSDPLTDWELVYILSLCRCVTAGMENQVPALLDALKVCTKMISSHSIPKKHARLGY